MSPEPESVITWGTRPAPALEFTVNFGVFAGREVARRELERLGEALLPMVHGLSVAAEHRYEVGQESTVALHQVRIEIDNEELPGSATNIEELRSRVAETIKQWVDSCLTGVSGQELTEAELKARDAVVEGVLEPRT
jgi:hypothetical protein